jgi:hypothetical protein
MKRSLLLALLIPLAACTTVSPEAKVRSRLIEAGLSPRMSACMAHRMVERLSIAQLRRLGSAANLAHKDVGAMRVDEILHRVRALGDPEIVGVVSKAALVCAIDA